MRITNVKVDLFAWNSDVWKTGVGTTFGGATQLGVVSVETDAGIIGNAFLGSSHLGGHHLAGPLVDYLKPVVMGQDPQDIGRLWQRLWKMNRRASIAAIGAIDICLWDINGKVAGQPIHRLLGTCKDAVPAYSSTAFPRDGGRVRPRRRCGSRNWAGRRTSSIRTGSRTPTSSSAARCAKRSATNSR